MKKNTKYKHIDRSQSLAVSTQTGSGLHACELLHIKYQPFRMDRCRSHSAVECSMMRTCCQCGL